MNCSMAALNDREFPISHKQPYSQRSAGLALLQKALVQEALVQEALNHVYAHSMFQITVDLQHAPIYRSLDSD
jgi:hypothetical protein